MPDAYPTTLTTSYTLTLRPCDVGSLTVNVNQLGAPANGAVVTISGGPNDYTTITQSTNSSGQTTFTNLPSGSDSYSISVSKLYTTGTATAVVNTGATTSVTVNLPDPPIGNIRAHVQWPTAAVVGASVHVTGGPGAIDQTILTDGAGDALFLDLPSGTGYTVAATKNGITQTVTGVSISIATTTAVTITMPTATITVNVTWAGQIGTGSANKRHDHRRPDGRLVQRHDELERRRDDHGSAVRQRRLHRRCLEGQRERLDKRCQRAEHWGNGERRLHPGRHDHGVHRDVGSSLCVGKREPSRSRAALSAARTDGGTTDSASGRHRARDHGAGIVDGLHGDGLEVGRDQNSTVASVAQRRQRQHVRPWRSRRTKTLVMTVNDPAHRMRHGSRRGQASASTGGPNGTANAASRVSVHAQPERLVARSRSSCRPAPVRTTSRGT